MGIICNDSVFRLSHELAENVCEDTTVLVEGDLGVGVQSAGSGDRLAGAGGH